MDSSVQQGKSSISKRGTSSSKNYHLLSSSLKKIESKKFKGRAPHQAALKAANKGHTDIYLQEVGTRGKGLVHHFKGTRRPLREDEITEHTERFNIHHKPQVVKIETIRIE